MGNRQSRGAGARTQQNDLIALRPEALEQLLRGREGETAAVEIALKIGEQVLVKAAEREAAGVGLDLEQDEEKPDGLESFTEVAGGIFRERGADHGEFRELALAGGVGLNCGLLGGEGGETAHEFGGSIEGDERGLVEDFAVRILRTGFEDLSAKSGDAETEPGGNVRQDVALGVVGLVEGEGAATDGGANLRIETGGDGVFKCFAAPVREDFLAQFANLFGSDVERVLRAGGQRVQLAVDPVDGTLRRDDAHARQQCAIADEDFIRMDGDG